MDIFDFPGWVVAVALCLDLWVFVFALFWFFREDGEA